MRYITTKKGNIFIDQPGISFTPLGDDIEEEYDINELSKEERKSLFSDQSALGKAKLLTHKGKKIQS